MGSLKPFFQHHRENGQYQAQNFFAIQQKALHFSGTKKSNEALVTFD